MASGQGIFTVTIPNGTADSNIIDLGDARVVGFEFPAAVDAGVTLAPYAGRDLTAAAAPVRNSAGAITITQTAGARYAVTKDDWASVRFLKLKASGNVAADRTVTIFTQ